MDVFWQVRGQQPPISLRSWLFAQGSLTQRVRETCPQHFHVKVLRQCWASPFADEARLLKLSPFSYARIREVQLCCGDRSVVFARTVIPVSSLQGGLRHLLKLGTQPLGEVLFTQRAQRINAQVCRLQSNHPLFQMLATHLEQKQPDLWMRRSIFILKNKPLLVQEIFL
jgi:chorismate--pyruvate lyase